MFSALKSSFQAFNTRGFSKTVSAIFYHCLSFILKSFGMKYLRKKIFNFEMYLDLYDRGISRTPILFGERELEHKRIIEMVLKPGMNFLDIGANIGYYALMQLKIIGDKGQLIAVEPSETNIKLLRKNLNSHYIFKNNNL